MLNKNFIAMNENENTEDCTNKRSFFYLSSSMMLQRLISFHNFVPVNTVTSEQSRILPMNTFLLIHDLLVHHLYV